MNKMKLTSITVALLLLSGCATPAPIRTPESSLATNTEDGVGIQQTVDSPCGSESGMTFERWRDWTKLNAKPLISEGHSNTWVDVCVDDLVKTIYLTASAPYPECAKVVKPIYNDATATDIVKLTIMVKMPPGYDPENGDWWYGV